MSYHAFSAVGCSFFSIDERCYTTIFNELRKWCDESTSTFSLDAFKIVYVALMKALVQEMVGNFNSCLRPFGIKVGELTDDSQMTKQEIAETQIIVTTPDFGEVGCHHAQTFRHILYEPCSPTHHRWRSIFFMTSMVPSLRALSRGRFGAWNKQTSDYICLVDLSATLPNYPDVATFLHVDQFKGFFCVLPSFRPPVAVYWRHREELRQVVPGHE